jgi:glycosyltransferase involved in cell wall biosynthesis
MPLVSVLLPVRNAAPWLDECLASIAAQSLTDHEIVAVDDGSSDGSGPRLDEAAARDPRLRVAHTPPLGLTRALNQALSLARADCLARMDADDVAHPERLERLWRHLREHRPIDFVASRVALSSGPGWPNAGLAAYVAWTNGLLEHADMEQQRFVDAPLIHPSVAFRRDALARLGGYRDFDGPEDYDLWLRAFDCGCRFAKLPQSLLTWRDSASRLTRSDPRYAAPRFFALKLEALLRGPLAAPRPIVIWGAGPIGKRWSRLLRGAGRPPTAFVEVAPRKIGQRIHGVPVLGVDALGGLREACHLAAVGQPGARERLRGLAASLGLVEGTDFLALA